MQLAIATRAAISALGNSVDEKTTSPPPIFRGIGCCCDVKTLFLLYLFGTRIALMQFVREILWQVLTNSKVIKYLG